MPVTGAAKRRQGDCRPGEEYRIISPEMLLNRGGRLSLYNRKAERSRPISEGDKAPPGFVPAACNQMNALRTREIWEAPIRRLETSDKPTQGKVDVTATQKSYQLIVLRDGESLLQGEAADRQRNTVRIC